MSKSIELPFINVRDVVIFPKMQMPLMIGRSFTIEAIRYAKKVNKGRLIVVSQKSVTNEKPLKKSDMYSIGTECKITQCVAFPDETMKVLIEGIRPIKIRKIFDRGDIRYAEAEVIKFKSSSKLLNEDKESIIDLLVRWNPVIATNDELPFLKELQKESHPDKFLALVFKMICGPANPRIRQEWEKMPKVKRNKLKISPRQTRLVNLEVSERQKILEEVDGAKQIQLIKSMLKDETLGIVKAL